MSWPLVVVPSQLVELGPASGSNEPSSGSCGAMSGAKMATST